MARIELSGHPLTPTRRVNRQMNPYQKAGVLIVRTVALFVFAISFIGLLISVVDAAASRENIAHRHYAPLISDAIRSAFALFLWLYAGAFGRFLEGASTEFPCDFASPSATCSG